MSQQDCEEFSNLQLQQFLLKSKSISCKVIGTINTIFKHKKYIIEVFVHKKIVIRCYKRYNQFQALHELIRMKYKNYQMGQFPSKYQIIGKQQTRKHYFQDMLNKIIKDHSHDQFQIDKINQTHKRILSLIYLFLASNIQEKQQKPVKKHSFVQANKSQLKKQAKQIQQIKLQKQHKQSNISSKKRNKNSRMEQKVLKQQSQMLDRRRHRKSLDLKNVHIIHPIRYRCSSVQGQAQVSIKQTKIQANEYQFKFQHQLVWKKRFIQVVGSGLYLYANQLDNYFKTHIELYRIKVQFLKRNMNFIDHFCEKMEFDLQRHFKENNKILVCMTISQSLYHEHDYNKILIRKPLKAGQNPQNSQQSLKNLKENIIKASQKSPISSQYTGVFSPIGKLFIVIHKLLLNWKIDLDEQTIKIRIVTGAMVYQSRPIVYSQEVITINQGFLIPVSDTFENVKIQVFSVKDDGWVKDTKDVGKTRGTFTFNMVQFLTKPQKYLISKANVRFETDSNKTDKYKTQMTISIQNTSDFSSIYSDSFANEHDGIPLKPFNSFDDIDDVALSIYRVLYIIGTIALFIQAFWRNVYEFKYPRLGYAFFTIILINAIFFQGNDIFRELIGFILFSILYQQKHVKLIVNWLMQKYLFSVIHRSFKKPKILSKSQVNYLKWSNLRNTIVEEYDQKNGKLQKKMSITSFEFDVHGKKFQVSEESQSFLQKFREAKKIIKLLHKTLNSAISIVEKIVNLLSWLDYKRTAPIALLLFIVFGLANGTLIRILVSLFCVHRFYKCMFFYDKTHYARNRLFAVHCFRYILQKSFPQLIGEKLKHTPSSQEELQKQLNEIDFPINDANSEKKLKYQMEQIMGVYLHHQQQKFKNPIKVRQLISMVESCQSRLKLKMIPGTQGISNDFQQLKQQTKQIPIIDIWLQNSLINLILNTPSQLFLLFYKQKFHNKQREDKKQKKNSQKEFYDQVKKNFKNLFNNQSISNEESFIKQKQVGNRKGSAKI